MSFFNNGKQKFFCLFVTSLAASGTLEVGVQYQYLRRLVRGEVLLQFDSFSDNMKGTETLNIDYFIRGLAQYFPPYKFAVKTEARNAPWNENPRSLSARRYAACLIDIIEFLASFLGEIFTDKINII